MGKTKMKPRGGNSPVIGNNGIHTEPGDNSKYANIALDVMTWPEIDHTDVPALEKRFFDYVEYCRARDIKIGNLGAYTALGIDKDIASMWANGNRGTPAHVRLIKKIRQICGMVRENMMLDGKVWGPTGIFWQKNYDGLKDQQDIVITPNQLEPKHSLEEIQEIVRQIPE